MKALPRLIPCLLLKDRGFVKTTRFDRPNYLGDPFNILKIFNEKEVDELVILDIMAPRRGSEPQYDFLEEMASECFMPLTYGGGLHSLSAIEKILSSGFEKVCLNTALVDNPGLIKEATQVFGNQSVVASIDVRRGFFGRYEAVIAGGKKRTGRNPVELARFAESMGAGEILLNSIDRDGTMEGYDLELIRSVSQAVQVPVVACGGAGSLQHLVSAVREGEASASAAGSLFVYQGPHRAVLINAPTYSHWRDALDESS